MAEAIIVLYGINTGTGKNNIYKNFNQGNINYCGYAPAGSTEDAEVWTITKITVSPSGTVTKEISTKVAWSSVPF